MTTYATGYRAGVDCCEPCPAAPEPWSPQRRTLTGPDGVLEHRLRTVLANDGSARWHRFEPCLQPAEASVGCLNRFAVSFTRVGRGS